MNEDSRNQGFIPILAADILAEMNETCALKPMIQTCLEINPLSETSTCFEKNISKLGLNNLDLVIEMYKSATDKEHKSRLSDILAYMKIKDDRIFEIHLEQLDAGYGASPAHLAIYGDARAIPHLSRALDKIVVSNNFFLNMQINELVHAIKNLGGSLSEKQKTKVEHAKRVHEKALVPLREKFGISEYETKIGRNDLCRCGSGKKYKKCCLH